MERLQALISELKRRRMFRALAGYAIGVFAVLQVLETIVHGLHLPDWTVSAVVVACVAGFPLTMLAAWFYDLTAEGISRTPDAPTPSAAPPTHTPVAPVAPGAMTALLEELAQAPEVAGAPRSLKPGDALGRYEILREIGRGGFGVVCEARDRELGRLVAVKTVRPRPGADPTMLRAEAEAAAQLQHPNIVTVHDVGSTDGAAWLVYELLRGETLEARLARGPLPPPEALRVAEAVAAGLAHAHRAGVIHRDLKPANVFLCDDGAVKILDFGLSRFAGSGGREGGTPGYMAPEQWRGEAQDGRADVFAAAVMLQESLTGTRPWPSGGARHPAAEGAAPAPLRVRGVPAALRKAVAAALDADPARRPRDGGAWLAALKAVRGAGSRARAVRAAVAASVVLALAAGVVVLRARGPREAEDGPRIPVAVADVANGTSDPELSGLSGMLVTSLEQSRRLTVLTRSRLVDAIRQLGREVPAVIDEPLAREVGKSLGVHALLLATVHRFDDRYAIELKALDPARNEYLFTLEEQGTGKASVPDLIDRLSRRTRERLSERARDVDGAGRPVANLTTSSLAAYEHYFRARQAVDLRQFDKAQAELQAALRIDTGFALARYEVTVLDSWTHVLGLTGFDAPELAEQKANLEAALKVADRLPEKERLSLLAWKASVDQRTQDAIKLRDQVAAAFPQDKEAVFWAADVRYHAGDAAGAMAGFEKALELDPDYLLAMEHLVQASVQLGRRDQELTWSRRWATAAATAEARRALGLALLKNGQGDEAERVYREGWSELTWPPAALAAWWVRHGRVAEAEAVLRKSLAAPAPVKLERPTQEQSFARILRNAQEETLLGALVYQGRLREAERLVDQEDAWRMPLERIGRRLGYATGRRSIERARAAVAAAGDEAVARDPGLAIQAAMALAVSGDAKAAEPILARVKALPVWPQIPASVRAIIDGAMAWRRGDLGEAAAQLKIAAAGPLPEPRYQALAVQAELAWSQGRAPEALVFAEQALAEPWTPGGAWFWFTPKLELVAAQAAEKVGDKDRARKHLETFQAMWAKADADLPEVAAARVLAARLGAGK